MKKIITHIKKFLILFTLVAYIFPILSFPIVSVYYILNTQQTVTAKDNNEKNPIPLLNDNNREPLNKDNVHGSRIH